MSSGASSCPDGEVLGALCSEGRSGVEVPTDVRSETLTVGSADLLGRAANGEDGEEGHPRERISGRGPRPAR
jgi:hypothetical protein